MTGFIDEGDRAMGGTNEKKVGEKTRVFVGARSETTDSTTISRDPAFEVQSIKHLGRMCTGL